MPSEEKLLEHMLDLMDRLDQYIEGNNQILHPKRIPLEIFAIAASASANKVVVGCVRNRRVRNAAVNSAGGWQRIFTGFDDEEPFVMNMSAVNVSINFDGETPETDNNAILIPSGYMFVYPGLILPVSSWAGVVAPLIGQVRVQDGTGAALQAVTTPSDAFASPGATAAQVQAFLEAFNNVTWDRLRTASAANLIAASGLGALLTTPPGMWSAVSTPATGAQATATRAAGGAGVRHVAWGIIVSFGAIAAPVATSLLWNLRDGATGAGAILASGRIAVPAAAAITDTFELSPLNIPGSAATAMTLEFSALLAGLDEGVTLIGYDAS